MTPLARRLTKTLTYWLLHIGVAASLVLTLTGDWQAAFAVGLLEPSVQAIVFLVREPAWEGRAEPPAASLPQGQRQALV